MMHTNERDVVAPCDALAWAEGTADMPGRWLYHEADVTTSRPRGEAVRRTHPRPAPTPPAAAPPTPFRIGAAIGPRPLLAFGNSTGDVPILRFARLADRPALRLLLLHDDAEREYEYAGAALTDPHAEPITDTAAHFGWTVVSMRDDWSRVFA